MSMARNKAVYLLLALAWLATAAWLVYEHGRVEARAEAALLNRARDISNTIAVVSRSGGPGVIRQSRLEEALNELTQSRELVSVALLNSDGEVVVASGTPLAVTSEDLPQSGTRWDKESVTVVNLVDFGTITEDDGTTRPPTIVIPSSDESPSGGMGNNPFPISPDTARRITQFIKDNVATGTTIAPERPPDDRRPPEWDRHRPDESPRSIDGQTSTSASGGDDDRWRRSDRSRPVFNRPFWMDEKHYEELIRKRGLHGFVLVLSTAAMQEEIGRDRWLRAVLGILALLAVGGVAVAWRSREGSTRLQMRLVRAHELNLHLQEMNIAAAGLAHETRNPLNIVRGLAQMIGQHGELPEAIRDRAHQITEEVDRVTGRLNEFINYSRPPQPRPAPTALLEIVRDVERTLESDCTEKRVQFELAGPPLTVEADESLLRQVLFNLLLNAVQAIEENGHVRVTLSVGERGEATMTVDDDGPGVPESLREEIFKPYFTTRDHGTGLGLAVVKQIVLAHRWEIEYVQNDMNGACFRIGGMRIL